jgi:hypothetical protein
LGELQLSSSLLALLGEHVEGKGATEQIGLGHPFLSCESFKAIVELLGNADLKAGGGHGDIGIDTAIPR